VSRAQHDDPGIGGPSQPIEEAHTAQDSSFAHSRSCQEGWGACPTTAALAACQAAAMGRETARMERDDKFSREVVGLGRTMRELLDERDGRLASAIGSIRELVGVALDDLAQLRRQVESLGEQMDRHQRQIGKLFAEARGARGDI